MNYPKLKDEELTALLKQGDAYSYTEIFERYNRLLLRHAYRLLSNDDKAHDVIQDVFLQLWQKRNEIEFNSSLSGYLFTAVKNRIFKLFAHQKVVLRYAASISAFMIEGYNIVEDSLMEKELSALISKEIDALPSKMREVFILNKKEHLTYKEIAERLNITDQTAKQQVYKAMKILKPKIDGFLAFFPFL
ncbi:RNA polymerase subunit sigma-70 [Pedobacter yonginense]|uniref:RNA polymerase subunit sigma-70 n=1 Tax=Pedobacter yonginense TaxID=651869 RepID=A0A317ETP9_9SPHI|nr:RNA polymerase sigma-70 factor [Pedobacter yonginense]PWS28616.1 RNA polymerase subunit sigma-70 [Pedobacter yonginense]